MDLRKAFDKVPHKQLSWKLETIGGLKGGLLRWMDDFLKNREMRTVIRLKKKNLPGKVFFEWSPARNSIGSSHICSVRKRYDKENKQLQQLVCR